MHALVLADGDRPSRVGLDVAWPGWGDGVALVVAADGGARLARDLDIAIGVWIGDGDSLGRASLDDLRRTGVPVELARSDKDESDTELAVRAALDRGATEVTILGGLGGRRLDHALANIGLLGLPVLAGGRGRLLDDRTRVTYLDAGSDGRRVRYALPGGLGDTVSLLPWGGSAEGVTTEGLRYPLVDEPLHVGPARGLSNVRESPDAAVSIRAGRLLVVESPARLST